jgi:two-component system OmpR family response regulator
MKALLVDDDPSFRRLASMALEEAGVPHVAVATSAEALAMLTAEGAEPFDLLLLDQELPGMKGQELLRLLRQNGHDIPVVLVTAHEESDLKVGALRAGADDYVVKPFEFSELVARVRAVIRRSRGAQPIRIGTLLIDPLQRRVERDGQPLDLTPREYELLYVLCQAQERIVSRNELLRRVWDMQFEPGTNFIQVHISRLRHKLGKLEGSRIRTVRGRGYRLVSRAEVDDAADEEEGTGAEDRGESEPDGAPKGTLSLGNE